MRRSAVGYIDLVVARSGVDARVIIPARILIQHLSSQYTQHLLSCLMLI